jgi:FkbM family methyltransferase
MSAQHYKLVEQAAHTASVPRKHSTSRKEELVGVIDVSSLTMEEKIQHWQGEFEYRTQYHEQGVRQLLLDLAMKLPANSVVVDSGAHVGDTGISLALGLRQSGRRDVHVLMVEPDLSKVAWIQRKLSQEGDLVASVLNSGIYSRTTRANIGRDVGHPGSWKIIPDVPDGEVQLRSISDILATLRPNDNFGLWHLDVEGTEEYALQGLGTHRPPHIVMEVIHQSKNLQDTIAELGYKRVRTVAPFDALFEHSAE